MRTAHSAARDACSGSSQRAKKGAARSPATRSTRSSSPKVRWGRTAPGLVRQQVGQRAVGAEPAGRLDHAGHEDVLEVGRLAHDDGQGREQAGDLGLDDGGEDALLAPGEGPVHGGPGEAGRRGRCRRRWSWRSPGGPGSAGRRRRCGPGSRSGRRPRGGGRRRRVPPSGAPGAPGSGRAAAAPTDETVWRFLSHCQPIAAQLRFTWPGATPVSSSASRARIATLPPTVTASSEVRSRRLPA